MGLTGLAMTAALSCGIGLVPEVDSTLWVQASARSARAPESEIVIDRPGVESRMQFLARIRHAVNGRRTFAKDYAIVSWSCGSGCHDSAIVRSSTGAVVFLPFTVTICRYQEQPALVFNSSSPLLIVNGHLEWRSDAGAHAKTEGASGCGTHSFAWDGSRLRRATVQ